MTALAEGRDAIGGLTRSRRRPCSNVRLPSCASPWLWAWPPAQPWGSSAWPIRGRPYRSPSSILGPAVNAGQVPDAIEALVETYLVHRKDGERFLDTVRRAGLQPFKEAVYADAH